MDFYMKAIITLGSILIIVGAFGGLRKSKDSDKKYDLEV
jgi:hypothetical protein